VMILSYLIGDNFFFRLAVHLFIGLTAGFLAVLIIQQILWPYLIMPLVNGVLAEQLWLGVPLLLILLLVLGQVPRLKGLGSIPLGFLLGLTAAVTIGGAVFGTLIPQVRSLIESFDQVAWLESDGRSWLQIVNSVIMLMGAVSTLSFFHFGRKWRINKKAEESERPRFFEILSKVGEVFIGITLGAIFAGVFSSALMAMIDRILVIGNFVVSLFGG